jgi:neutral trehalase
LPLSGAGRALYALLHSAKKNLADISRVVGEDRSPFEERAGKTAEAMDDKLWDEERGAYLGFDMVTERHIPAHFAPNLAGPLYAGIPHKDKAGRMVEGLESNFYLGGDRGMAVPSYDPYGLGFSPVRYWRGPVWININWFLMHGLRRYGFDEHASQVRQTIVDLVRNDGLNEYFDPFDGNGHGSNFFSWTAALFLAVMMGEGGE